MALPPRHVPAIPSPLNPTIPKTPVRQQTRGSYARTGTRKTSGSISLTQRLMRQKAAEAWKSLSARDVVSNVSAATVITGLKPNTAVGSWQSNYPVKKEDPQVIEIDIGDCREEPMSVNAFDGGGMGLWIVGMNLEKQTLIRYHDKDPLDGNGALDDAFPSHERRPRSPRLLTIQRILSAIGVLCLAGIMSAIWLRKAAF